MTDQLSQKNDGVFRQQLLDILQHMPSSNIKNYFFQNNGNLTFSNVSTQWGIDSFSNSNGAAYADLDNDGDLDLVVNNVNQKAFTYRNNSREINKNNYIGISLKGKGKNTFAIGSSIKIYRKDEIISREVMPSRGFQSSVDYKVIAGLGNSSAIDSMIVIWPDRSYLKIDKPAANKVHVIEQSNAAKIYPVEVPASNSQMFQQVKQNFEKHTEEDYVDFYNERGVPMLLSREGPKAAYGDVNGDGLTDVYIAGAANQPGQLYLQTANGFILKKQLAFNQLAAFEDVAALFFDCDKDGDLDLFVGSGGNNYPPHSFQFQNRLYRNDGKGNFEIDGNPFPAGGMNTGVAVAEDFDSDGDVDLFIGSRSVPQNYGLTPQSFLLVNDGTGKFTDIAKTKNPEIANIGMTTGAVWANVAGDKRKELVIVGDWMAPRVFSFQSGKFAEVKSNLNELYGWWKTVAAADVDGDGDEDLVLGNLGENFYLRPNSQQPVKMFISDFDDNGTAEKIITQTINGKDKPVFLKRELVEQIASLRKQNLKYGDYADKSIQELFTPDVLKKSVVKQFNYSSSCIAINNGNGNFTVKKLPLKVQLSCVNAISCTDINNDGKIDLVLGGNQLGFLPQFSRLDASFGHVLINKGKGEFEWIDPKASGIDIPGEIKDIAPIHGKDKRYFLFVRNNDYPVLYQLKLAASKENIAAGTKVKKR
ncbi:MAG: VCBS repeat-containing protein [Segetibacter sp.]|nr:VCBS repeat-containing protein [Segetibacter sp.]